MASIVLRMQAFQSQKQKTGEENKEMRRQLDQLSDGFNSCTDF